MSHIRGEGRSSAAVTVAVRIKVVAQLGVQLVHLVGERDVADGPGELGDLLGRIDVAEGRGERLGRLGALPLAGRVRWHPVAIPYFPIFRFWGVFGSRASATMPRLQAPISIR